MSFQEISRWIMEEFGYPVPKDYLDFLQNGDFDSTARMFYIIDKDSELILEISHWYTYNDITSVYENCYNEKMIDKYYLPIFDSCNCVVVIDCNPQRETYGQVFMRTPTGYFDELLQENVYLKFDFVATSFSQIINNLKSDEEINELDTI